MPSDRTRTSRWTLLVCGNCGEPDTVDQANENDAHCSACDEWMNTEAIEVVAVDALLSDEAIDELCRQRALVPGAESHRTSRAILEAVLAAALPGTEVSR